MKKKLQSLIEIAEQIGRYPDFIQGAGGNLSVKINDKQMLIKASGLRFNELGGTHEFALADYKKLCLRYGGKKSFFNEKEEAKFIAGCSNGIRPSMEAGFHAFLGTYVLHTHSVYSNIISCAVGGEKIAMKICRDLGIRAAFLDYINPGPDLAFAMGKLIKKHLAIPSVIFLANHGLVISGNTAKEVLTIHKKLNDGIKRELKLSSYPRVGIKMFGKIFKSKYLSKFNGLEFKRKILFPDQVVFCDSVSLSGKKSDGAKIQIDSREVLYNMGRREAIATEEILNAWNYIFTSIRHRKMRVRVLPASSVEYLKNMESEKHRKNMMK